MWGAIIQFAALLGIRILNALGAKDEMKKNLLEWAKKYNESLFKNSSTLSDEWDKIMENLKKEK